MPNKFHRQQYYIAAALFALCLLAYIFAPNDRAAVIAGFAGGFAGFMTGKFTNGFPGKGKEKDDGA